ncbi:MAG: hypothetical protein P4L46_05325 [Fimbriimonas sp.]|nr:hypothetical protein [Fimbriimonas sp.]
MKHLQPRIRRRREAGIALITALMISLITATLLAASLCVSMTSSKLGWNQERSEAALQMADAGINWELQYIAENSGQTNVTLMSSQPVAATGTTIKYPSESFAIKGANGTVPGFTGGQFWVYASNDTAGSTAWDGVTSPFYITSSGLVNGAWNRVQIKTQSSSVFNIYSSATTGSYSGDPTTITVGGGGSVVATGPITVNGTVTTGSGSTISVPTGINSNGCTYTSGQLTTTHIQSGGKLCTNQAPVVYPTCASLIKKSCGHTEYSDSQAWSWCSNHCNNSSCVYTYKSGATDDTVSSHNCCQLTGGCGTSLSNSCWNNAGTHPGTYNSSGYWYWWWSSPPTYAVQTLIFEPGDYYFTSMQLAYDCSCEMVIDPEGYASGCTPGQVRFWVNDPGSSPTNDSCSLPITNTCPSGTSTPDCGKFRIYYGKDNCCCQFNRPSGCCDWQGNTITGDFEYHCGIYACTRQPDTTVSTTGGCTPNTTIDTTKHGCKIGLCGCDSNRSHGCCKITGSCLCDKLSCQNSCTLNYQASSYCGNDPCGGGQILSWCKK